MALDGHDIVSLPHHGKTINTISLCSQEMTRAQAYESLTYCENHRGEIDVVMAKRMAKVPAPGGYHPMAPQPLSTYAHILSGKSLQDDITFEKQIH
jgi:hypothetical protein